jgi:hypothetical protein
MALAHWLNLLGFTKQRRDRRAPSQKSRRLTVESLEDRSLLAAVANLVAYRPITDYINYTTHQVPEALEDNPVRPRNPH